MSDTSYLKTHVAWLRGRAADYDAQGFLSMAEDYSNRADRINALLAEREPVMEVHKNSAGQISLRTPNGDAWDMSKHVGLTLYTTPQPQAPEGYVLVPKEQIERLINAMDTISKASLVEIAGGVFAAAQEGEK